MNPERTEQKIEDVLRELVEAYDACFEPEGYRSKGPSRGNRLAEALDEAHRVLGMDLM